MKREPLPFYPLIVAVFPIVSVYSANLAYVPAHELVRPVLAVALAAILLTAVLGLIFRSAARGAAATAVFAVCFFAYSWFYGLTAHFFTDDGVRGDIGWYAATALLVGLAAWRVRRVGPLNVLASFIAVIALGNIGLNLLRSERLSERTARTKLSAGQNAAYRPDVFYIILDGHGRRDSILRTIGYDDEPFLKGLRDRGFFIADRSHANYCQTELSLSSSLNMDFIQNLLPKVDPTTDDRAPLGRLIDDNEVARRFRSHGYGFVAVTSGFPPVSFSSADVQMGTRWGGTMVETTLLQMTPLATENTIGSQFIARQKNLLGAFANLNSLGTPTIEPRFVMVHILAPHPPFVFNADGSLHRHHGQFCYCDGSDYITYVGPPDQYRIGYAGQVAWAENRTLEAIDHLLAGEGPGRRPIIIVQGDHGSKLRLDQASLANTDVHECFPNLNAYLVPTQVAKDLRPDITPVNSFRVVLHDLFGDDLKPLPDRSWYSTFPLPYAFTEVTNRIEPVTGRAPTPPPGEVLPPLPK